MSIADLWVVLAVVAFFALCVLLIRGCDRIIGSDETSDLAIETEQAPARAVSMTGENIAGLVLALLLASTSSRRSSYPERF